MFTSDVCLLIAGLCELFIGPQPGHRPHPGSRHGLDRRRGGDPKQTLARNDYIAKVGIIVGPLLEELNL